MDLGRVRFRRMGGNILKFAAVLFTLLPELCLGQIQLGKLSFAKANVLSLDQPTRLAVGLVSYSYLNHVGGIAFGSQAEGEQGMTFVALKRDARLKDGARLQVTVLARDGRKSTVTAPIFDWQLVPIARFAETDQDACFSLFGRVEDEEEQRLRLARGERLLSYHSAFKNTLLGLRLFQADILILRPDACDLPTLRGRYLLGKGEAPPNVPANQQAYRQVGAVMARFNVPFQSYVVSDHGQTVRFSIRGQQLSLTGVPYWYCWRRKMNDAQSLDDLQTMANQRGNETCQREFKRDVEVLGGPAAEAKWTDDFHRQRHSEIFDQVLTENLLQPMPEMSLAISTEVWRRRVNPAIYQALVTTMRYAALFRHFKQEAPEEYADFVRGLKNVATLPAIETPSVLVDPADRRRSR